MYKMTLFKKNVYKLTLGVFIQIFIRVILSFFTEVSLTFPVFSANLKLSY